MEENVLDLLDNLLTVSFDEENSAIGVALRSEDSFVNVSVAKEKAHI